MLHQQPQLPAPRKALLTRLALRAPFLQALPHSAHPCAELVIELIWLVSVSPPNGAPEAWGHVTLLFAHWDVCGKGLWVAQQVTKLFFTGHEMKATTHQPDFSGCPA